MVKFVEAFLLHCFVNFHCVTCADMIIKQLQEQQSFLYNIVLTSFAKISAKHHRSEETS